MLGDMPPLLLEIWDGLARPLTRLVVVMSIGLFIATVIESLNWTRGMARIAAPLVRLGRLRDIAGASFSLAFFSPMAANSLLSESYEEGKMSRRELVFANLFNSLPAYLTHFPTLFFMSWSALGWPAVIYASLTLGAAALRTTLTILCGRLLLPPLEEGCVTCRLDEQDAAEQHSWMQRVWKKFRKKLPKIIKFTVPVYCIMFVMQHIGWFGVARAWLADHVALFGVLRPEAVGIVVFHVAAEFGAALAAASSVIASGTLSEKDIVLALLVGNILSTPMRAFRHQFPAYAGYFRPKLAFELVIANQLLRASSIITVGYFYYILR